jgi:hypothetical protein
VHLAASKKRLLIPLNNPYRPTSRERFKLHLLRAVLFPPLWLIGKVWAVCIGWWLRRLIASRQRRRFEREIRDQLHFLFSEHGAQIVRNVPAPFPPGFDACVTVEVGALRLILAESKLRGEFSVAVASKYSPEHSEDFYLVADGAAEWTQARSDLPDLSLATFGELLRPRLEYLRRAMSADSFEATFHNAVSIHNASVDGYAAKLRASGIEPRII